jgi:hypothetical protein
MGRVTILFSRAARRVRKQTTSRQACACRAVVACDLQLLPLPNCQRTSAARRVCQKQISDERFPKQKSVLSDFLLAGSRCTLLECSDSHPLKIGPTCILMTTGPSVGLPLLYRHRNFRPGGDDGTRTRDPRVANAMLSQLSYIPSSFHTGLAVGVLGFEPRTSALSELRSSQLSYTPPSGEIKKPNPKGLALSVQVVG